MTRLRFNRRRAGEQGRPRPPGCGQADRRARVRAAFTAALCRPAGPFVRTAFCAARRRFALPRRCALLRAWRDSAKCDAAAVPSRSRAARVARDRAEFGFRAVALTAFFLPGGAGSFTPARLALDNPMAIACLAERAPCFPSRTCSISSRTYSPACIDGDFAMRARRVVSFAGMATIHLHHVVSWSLRSLPSKEWRHSIGTLPIPMWCRPCWASGPCRNPERSPASSYSRPG